MGQREQVKGGDRENAQANLTIKVIKPDMGIGKFLKGTQVKSPNF